MSLPGSAHTVGRLAGRWFLPLLLLGLACLTLHFADSTALSSLRQAQFDRYQRQMPRLREDEPVIVVGIDSQSLAELGQWPWSRETIARLGDRILAGQPLALGIDMVFAERDRYSPAILREHLPDLPAGALDHLSDPDASLARTLGSGPTVLAVVGLGTRLPGARTPFRPLPRLSGGDPARLPIAQFPAALVSRTQLEKTAAGEGFINAGQEARRTGTERGVLRKVPMLALIENQPFLPLSLEMVRLALGEHGQVVLDTDSRGLAGIRIGDYRLPLQANGDLLIHYGKANANYYLSASDVLAGVHPVDIFRNRFVIIGFNSTGLQDSIVTPLGENVPGVDVHAQIIESLLTGEALRRPYWMPWLEMLCLVGGGLILIVSIPLLRPRLALGTYLTLSATLIGAGYLAFHLGRWLFDGPSLAVLLTPLFIALLGKSLLEADRRQREAERALQSSREAAARTAGELDAARRIQMGLLPDPETRFAGETRFEVAATLEPARAVGGDFYDCFMLDERRLCLAIGDVSGKGIPASLFMAISKTLTGILTRRNPDLGQAVRDLECELNRENPEYLFVTAFIAVLDSESGLLEFVCAGHDAPLLLRDGQVRKIDTLERSGPPLCAAGAYPYETDRLQLLPGDRLCLYTDGVTEATDVKLEMFGGPRLAATFRAHGDQPLKALGAALQAAVRHHEAGHPPADDLTLLLLDYRGGLTPTPQGFNAG